MTTKHNYTNNWNNDERDAYILSVENLSKVFDSPAGGIVVLNNINFRIKKENLFLSSDLLAVENQLY